MLNCLPELASSEGTAPAETAQSVWSRRFTSPLVAAILLAAFWIVMLSSVREKSLTADEAAHAAAGYSYWKFNDYRLNPENGNLPQRIMALPLVLAGYAFPSTDNELWRGSDAGLVGDAWFHRLGNNVPDMLWRGRAVMGLVTVILGALVWYWSRNLFGPSAAMLSLVLFVTNPTILANGPLMVSDATSALFFVAATLAIWAVLHRLTAGRLLISALLVGGLFVSKISAVAIIPVALTLAAFRVWASRPLWVGFGLDRELSRRSHQAWALIAATIAHLALVPLTVWACYGFRYSAFAPSAKPPAGFRLPWEFVLDQPSPLSSLETLNLSPDQKARANEILERYDWDREAAPAVRAVRAAILTPTQAEKLDALPATPPRASAARFVDFFRQHELLPEAFLYGAAHTWRFSRMRAAFFNGEYGATGWKSFFPYTVLVKTPLATLAVIVLAAAAALWKWRVAVCAGATWLQPTRGGIYATAPLWCLLLFYWAAVIPSRLNIGHRYVMVTYAPVFILCGAVAWWLEAWQRNEQKRVANLIKWPSVVLCGLLLAGAAEVAYRYPNYLAYFNGLVSPAKAYRHLVDSSLDWGQDLPGVKRYIDAHSHEGPFYLSYFGAARPETYGISARLLICGAGIDQPRSPFHELRASANELGDLLAKAKREWPNSEIVAQTALPGNAVQAVLMQQPAVPAFGAGTYFISASMLQTVWAAADGPLGPWNARFEATYQELRRLIAPLLVADPAERARAFAVMPLERWTDLFESYAQFRFARLAAYLRQREPDDNIGYSILVYRLSAADLMRALDGPAPELGIDFPTRLMAQIDADGGENNRAVNSRPQ